MSRHTPLTIVAYFQACALIPPSSSKLNSLLFYAEGWSQAVMRKALIEGDFIALSSGPRHPAISKLPRDNGAVLPVAVKPLVLLTPSERELLDKVWKRYGEMLDVELAGTLLQPGTPWANAYFGGYRESAIPRNDIGRWCTRLGLAGRASKGQTA